MAEQSIAQTLKINSSQLNAYSAGLLQGKAYRTLNAHLTRALLEFDLSIPEWKLLGQLYDNGDMRLAQLADQLNVEPPLVTALVDSLEKKEFVLRKNDQKDKRAKVISSTEKSLHNIPEIEIKIKKTMAMLLSGITREELITYMKVLTAIVDNG